MRKYEYDFWIQRKKKTTLKSAIIYSTLQKTQASVMNTLR